MTFEESRVKTSFFTTGIGNYNTILNLTKFFEHNNFDFVVNIGVCGYLTPLISEERVINSNKKENFIQVARIFNLANKKELIVPQVLEFGKLESIACSEKPVFDENDLTQFSPYQGGLQENYVDMESYGFEMVCDSFSVPRIILKIPVDKIGTETKNFDFEKAEKYLKENIDYKILLEKIIKYLENVEGKVDFEKYFEHFNFTFSEKEIFKKLYYKLKAKSLKLKVLDEFMKKGDRLDKKESREFLKELKNNLG